MLGMRGQDTNLKPPRKVSTLSDLTKEEKTRIDPQLKSRLNGADLASRVPIIVKLTSLDDAVLDTLPRGFTIRQRMKLLALVSGETSVETILLLAQCSEVIMISEDLEVKALEGPPKTASKHPREE